jgi:hypothetical protein
LKLAAHSLTRSLKRGNVGPASNRGAEVNGLPRLARNARRISESSTFSDTPKNDRFAEKAVVIEQPLIDNRRIVIDRQITVLFFR